MELLKSQTNVLFELIEAHNLSPSSFEFSSAKFTRYAIPSKVLKYLGTNFYFSLTIYSDESSEVYYSDFTPARYRILSSVTCESWLQVTSLFPEWLEAIKREINIPDKWKQLQEGMPDFKLAQPNDEGKFTFEEVIQIENKVHLLKEKLKQIPLTMDQVKVLNEKLDYCIELSKTANKFDWASFFLGVIANIIIAMTVTPENSKLIWEAVKQVFSSFLLK